MAMKTASPWWFSALFAAGLVLLFLGERPFNHIPSLHYLLSGAGLILALAMTGLRVWTYAGTSGARRTVERILLMCHAGVIVALLLYTASTQWGMELLGLSDLEEKSLARYQGAMSVIWSIVMAASLVPLFMMETSLGTARRSRFVPSDLQGSGDDAAVESFRVRDMGNSGLTIALAVALLMVTCNIAKERNIRHDVSYFKTSSPGSSTVSFVSTVSEPIRVLLFFPKVSDVKNEVLGYFNALSAATGRITIEEHDRFTSLEETRRYQVSRDGAVVFVYRDNHETIQLTIDPTRSRAIKERTELKELDSKVNKALFELIAKRRNAYVTTGHGELNDSDSVWAQMGLRAQLVKEKLRSMNFTVRDLGVGDGLGNDVPSDADIVLILGPSEEFLPSEIDALKRYLERGGRLMLAIDPEKYSNLSALEGQLGVRFDPTPLTDDEKFLVQTRRVSDRRYIVTERFSSHAAITTLSRARSAGMVFLNAGSLVDAKAESDQLKRTYIVRSMETTFRDLNNNFAFDEGQEKREQYNVIAAVEDRAATAKELAEDQQLDPNDYMRALIVADAEIFADQIQLQVKPADALFRDSLRWLAGDEHIAGDVVSEKDVFIQHTRNEDVLLFYGTIIGAPLFVLALGLWLGWWRHFKSQRRSA